MAIKEVKAGEKYKLELLCIHNSGKVIIFETPTGDHLPFRESDLECVSPARQDVRPEHSTVSTLSYPERVWNELWAKEMRDHSKSMNPDTANGTKNTETAPKYDPCREFRKGDRARVVERNGRSPICFPIGRIKVGDIVTVAENETGDVFIKVLTKDGHEMMAPWFMLELVAPAEELEPYYVSTNIDCSTCTIFKRVGEKKLVYSAYYFVHGNGCSNAILGINEAKAAAEAECKRLNEEYRKEQSND